MTDLVDPSVIEGIVGANRHQVLHIGRAVTAEQTVYILHSERCRARTKDIRECAFSIALDDGITEADWGGREDIPVVLGLTLDGDLIPVREVEKTDG